MTKNSTTNIGFKDCTFNNCTFNIGDNSSSASGADALVGVVILGGLWAICTPSLALGSVLAIGTTVVKGCLTLGLGSSLFGIGSIVTKSIVESKREEKLLLGSNEQSKEYISANYKVLEDQNSYNEK